MTGDGRPHAHYTHGHAEAVLRSHRWRTVENSAPHLLARLVPGTSVLDVGCGPGTVTAGIAARVAPGAVVGIDSSEEVVALAAAGPHPPNATFRVGDAYALGVADGAFDVVHEHQVLHHVADPVAVVREMRRACRPGGTVSLRETDYGAMSWWPQLPGLDRWRDLFREVTRANGGEPDAGRRLVRWAHAAGLTDLVVSASVWSFATPGDREWWAQTWAERTTGPPFADRAVGLGLASRAVLESCAAAWREWASDPDACFLVPHVEVLATA